MNNSIISTGFKVALTLVVAAQWLAMSASAGPIISISNRTANAEGFTDVIAYEKNAAGNLVNKKNILGPGNPQATRIVLAPNEVKLFDAGFEPTDVMISNSFGLGKETETKIFKKAQLSSKPIAMLTLPNGVDPIFLAIDFTQFNFIPPVAGSLITFTSGLDASLPGWFAGTTVDFDTGDIGSAYTGSAIVQQYLEVDTIPAPEPNSLVLAATGVAVMLVTFRWASACRRRRTPG
jgi:hypothetical protein